MRLAIWTISILMVGSRLWSQETTGIEGRVTDARTGLPVSSALVQIIHTAIETQTDASGTFRFLSLTPGSYDLKFSTIGYRSLQISSVVTAVGTVSRMDVRLQPDPLNLPEMTVRATADPSAGVLSGAKIISRADIQAIKPFDLPDLLEKQGLAGVVSDGTPGGRRAVTIRGSASDQVLVLIDGQPINEAADGIADLSRISLAEILQVEFYPQAPAMLGSQAIGGVINIITLRPGFNQTRLQAGAGAFGNRQGSIALGRVWGTWPLLGVFEHRESEGRYRYRVMPDDGIDVFTRNVEQTLVRTGADFRRDFLSLKMDTPGLAEFVYRRTFLYRHNPDYLPLPVYSHEAVTADDRQEFTLTSKSGDRWYRPTTVAKFEGYSQQTSTDYGPQYPLLNQVSNLRGEVYSAKADWTMQTDWRQIAFGTGIHYERLWSDNLQGGYAGRLHEFAFLQVQGEPFVERKLPAKLAIFTGVRADLYQNQQPFIHPKLGLEIGGGEAVAWSLRGEYAGAYHLPSFNALFWQEDLQSRGNPELEPERSLNREIAARIGYQGLELGLVWFDRQIWDMIYWRMDFENKWKPLNLRSAQVYGTEITLQGRLGEGLGSLNLNASHRWMRSQNQSGEPNTDGMILPYRPLNTTTLSLQENLYYFSTDLTARWISRRFTTEANTLSLSPYTVWDAGLTKIINLAPNNFNLTLRGEVRNLFDRSYRIIDNAPMPLREFWITVAIENSTH